MNLRPTTASGLEAVSLVTDLARCIQRVRPRIGVWEAADFQWWWRRERATDSHPQRFWVDRSGRPEAAAVLTDWGGRVAIDVLAVEPDAELRGEAWRIGLADAERLASPLEVMVDVRDEAHVERLRSAGFTDAGMRGGSAWRSMTVPSRVPTLPAGYSLDTRASRRATGGPHHFTDRNGPDVERRLRETSLYRPDLDLVVVDDTGLEAAYGLFWFDPVTRLGFVEPMGTAPEHRRRGLARHLLGAGLAELAAAGATETRVNYDRDHEPSRSMYLEAGFEPGMHTALWERD